MRDLVIIGTSGTSIDLLDTALAAHAAGRPEYRPVAFVDDNPSLVGTVLHGLPVRGPLENAREFSGCWFINGIGSTRNFWRRAQIIARLGVTLDRFATLVHPSASVSAMASLGFGTAVFQNATVTANARIGNHVVILPNSVVSHDCQVGDYTCIAGGVCLSGGVVVEESSYLGSNCTVNNSVRIGRGSLIGMGAIVLSDIPENAVYVGNPARLLRRVQGPA